MVPAFEARSGAGSRPALVFASLLVLLLVGSCGARTELLPAEEPCATPDDVRGCRNACGAGQQTCEAGYWSSCRVPLQSRSCEGVCGAGLQTCQSGSWSSCVIPDRERACDNECGSGVQHCSQEQWGTCQVKVAVRQCQDPCGTGQQSCEQGSWGACVVPPVVVACESVCGKGVRVCQGGGFQPCNAPQPKPPKMIATVRDFDDTHPDFELPVSGNVDDREIVKPDLGPDDKPVYGDRTSTITTAGRFYFDQWYRDTPSVNESTLIRRQLTASSQEPGLFVYRDDYFFPIDGQLLGNQGRAHNFHFTLEWALSFNYIGGEVFRFTGDDDLWVFINRKLVIDLGGVHQSESASVELDQLASQIGLIRGGVYPLKLFFAERHTIDSRFSVETSIADPGDCE